VASQAVEDQGFVTLCFFLDYLCKIFIYFCIIGCPKCCYFACLAFSLNRMYDTSYKGVSVLTFSSLRSMRELTSLISFLSSVSMFF
jgi:hypothetical protein